MHKIAKRPKNIIHRLSWALFAVDFTLTLSSQELWPTFGFLDLEKGSIFVFTSVAMLDKRMAYRVLEAYVQERTKASSANTIVWIHQENERNRLSSRQPQKKTSVQTLCLQKRVIFVLPPKQKRVYVCPRCSVYHWLIRNSVQILDCFYKSINSYKPCFTSSSSNKSPEPILSLMVIIQIIVIFFGIGILMLAVIFKCWNS